MSSFLTDSDRSGCDCLQAIEAIKRRIDVSARPHDSDALPLPDTLLLGRSLVNQWELLNGCPQSEAHATPQTLRVMTDAVNKMLEIYEVAAFTGDDRSIPVFIGNLQLDDQEEIDIVRHEALRLSTIRLGSLVQDIEEDLKECPVGSWAGMDRPLNAQEVKGLMGRLFRLLGRLSGSAECF